MTRVLVIDDDIAIRRVIEFALYDAGYQVDEAADGNEALEQVSRNHPDVILLDMKMPGMDGWEFIRRYREHYNHQAPIIVLTAAKDASDRASDVDVETYMSKPFELDVLIDCVSAVAKKAAKK